MDEQVLTNTVNPQRQFLAIPHTKQMADFDLFTSLRYDPKLRSISFNTDANGGSESPYLLFSYHVQRLAKAAEVFAWSLAIRTMSSSDIEEILMKKCEESILQVDEQVRNIGLRVSELIFLF